MSRAASRWANYPGDCTDAVDRTGGRNTGGEWLIACEATYDAATNKTRMGFHYATEAEVQALRTGLKPAQ